MTQDSAVLDLVIVGAGGFAREVRHVFAQQIEAPPYRFKGFLGRDHGAAGDLGRDPLLLGDPESYVPGEQDRFVLAIGEMRARNRVVAALTSKGAQFICLVHPQAYVASSAVLGHGVLVYPLAVVSHEAVLEDFVKLNFFSCVGHNARLGRLCLLAPYATVNGFAHLEESVYMSTHSTVGPQVRVGAHSKISANSAITFDVPPHSFVFGVPGKVTRQVEFG